MPPLPWLDPDHYVTPDARMPTHTLQQMRDDPYITSLFDGTAPIMEPDPLGPPLLPAQDTIEAWMEWSQWISHRQRSNDRHLPARYQRAILVAILVVALWAMMIADIINHYLVH